MNITAITALVQTALQAILTLLQSTKVVPPVIDQIISTLIGVLPSLGAFGEEVLGIVQQIVAELQSGSQSLTPAQIAAVDAINSMVDTDYVNAMAGYLKNHPALPSAKVAVSPLPTVRATANVGVPVGVSLDPTSPQGVVS